ncbi:uncharacterized protein LOC122093663 [Macadamia integrifolia]|uniref:uncharacterized protein LOC122093663 n=1 Tax=Macadamia integrifolia TaxID=60698 RepID=UPI001C52FD39|nr:uncharacterized protein LOC122093663 [Macadamia integrifolia]XP_042519980.1 uncharacterized protein LOC122093663 [Macadamia integrifolia]XP_042519981.1 uncharacterized protein LOC122093663 [Macadamia integrifolia]
MGTKVHCKRYMPEYYSMRDLNVDANNGSWPVYYDDETLKNGQYYNAFLPRHSTDLYLGYDKEMMKQTMLKHEAIFRDQVFELHRLYKIQQDLMDELKRKEVNKYTVSMEPMQSSPFPSQMPSEVVQKMWQNLTIRPSDSGTENIESAFSSIKENNKQACPFPAQNRGSSKVSKLPRKRIDLQLPADEYIDSEEGEPIEEEKLSNHSVALKSDVKLCLGNGGNPNDTICSLRADSCLWSTDGLADLNEPIQVDEATSSASVDFVGPLNSNGEVHLRVLPGKPNSGILGLPGELFQNSQRGRCNGTCSSTLLLESEGNKPEWLSYNPEAGQSRSSLSSLSQSFSPEKFPTLSEPVQVDLKRSHELPAFLRSDQISREPWRERASCTAEISERNSPANNYPGSVVASHVPFQYPIINQFDASRSPSVSSCRKAMSCLSQNAVAVQALPCIVSSRSSNVSIQGSGIIGDKWSLDRNLRLNPSFGGEVSQQNGFYQVSRLESKHINFPKSGFDYLNCGDGNISSAKHCENHYAEKYLKGPECMDVKFAKDMNLNVALQNGFQDGVVPQQDLAIDGRGKHEVQPGGLPWLGAKPASNDGPAGGKRSSSQLGLGFLKEHPQQSLNKSETGSSPSLNFIQNLMSASCHHDVGPNKTEPVFSSEKKILGIPIFEKAHISSNRSSSLLSSPTKSRHYSSAVQETENSWKKLGIVHIDLSLDPPLQDSGKKLTTDDRIVKKGLDNSCTSSRNHINLNTCTNEEEIPPESSVPRDKVKIAVEIDLEALPVPDTEEDIPPAWDICIGNQPEELVQSSQHGAGEPHEELARIAAGALVSIASSTIQIQLECFTCQQPESYLRDSLYWFAEVVTSNMGDLESEVRVTSRDEDGCDHNESSFEGVDYFECMTLKLTETKVEEYWCRPQALENVEETVSISKPTRPRKGHGRRGRQRRDFQRDILPGLASLSRHEVTEDLQTIGGLMRATGQPWQTGLARRNAARNGWARGRRRSKGPVPMPEASNVCPPPVQPLISSEVGLEERNLTGWGKTPRRPRRQRCPAGNPPSLPSLTAV